MFQNHKDAGGLASRLADSFVGPWDPIFDKNGGSSQQGRADKDQYPGPEVCWDYAPAPLPLGLVDMTEEEKQVRVSEHNIS